MDVIARCAASAPYETIMERDAHAQSGLNEQPWTNIDGDRRRKREHPSTLVRASDHNSVLENISYTLRQISQVLNTILSFVPGFIVPEVRDWITTAGMGKKFNPATDIGSLEGKVILVTGGMAPPTPIAPNTDSQC